MIHSFVTLEGGHLLDINWATAKSHRVPARCFKYELRARLEADWFGVFSIFVDQLRASFDLPDETRHQQLIEDWAKICPLLISIRRNLSKKPLRELERMYVALDYFCEGSAVNRLTCGGCKPDNCAQHVRGNNMQGLVKDLSRKRKR